MLQGCESSLVARDNRQDFLWRCIHFTRGIFEASRLRRRRIQYQKLVGFEGLLELLNSSFPLLSLSCKNRSFSHHGWVRPDPGLSPGSIRCRQVRFSVLTIFGKSLNFELSLGFVLRIFLVVYDQSSSFPSFFYPPLNCCSRK